MEKVKINTEFIKLDQFLKWVGICDTGADAKDIILQEKVIVNSNLEMQRGKKLRPGDIVEIEGKKFEIDAE